MNWTDKLIDPLARALRDTGPWLRVEESKTGGWICLAGNPGDPAVRWHQLEADDSLTALEPMNDKRLPNMASACSRWIGEGYSMQMVAWRVGSRSIFRLSRNDVHCYAKIFRKDRITAERWRHLRASSPGGLWRTPEVLDWNPKDKILIIEECPGQSLNQQWTSGLWLDQHLESMRQVLQWLSSSEISDELPIHTTEEEIRILNMRLEVFHRTLREPHAEITGLVEKVIERLAAIGNQELVLTHRDLHDKQILTSREGGNLIDLDLLARGSGALDPGNIIAHCRLRAEQGHPVPWPSIGKILSQDAIERGIERESLIAWTASTLARISLIYSRRKRPENLITKMLSSLDDLLKSTGEWQGVIG
ncbi:MAG: hypothetical protein VX404_08170 [Planctomycetota bacterium]|nr:hypothetical protein [Planctomycetota bacterium]